MLGQARTFLPWYYKKEFVAPLALTTVVPLTLDADPSLFTAPGAERNRAWASAVGPDSRLQSVITGTADAPVTWAIDPAILGPAAGSARRHRGRQRPDPDADADTARRRTHARGRGRRAGPDVGPGLPARRRLGRARPVGAALRRPGHRHRARPTPPSPPCWPGPQTLGTTLRRPVRSDIAWPVDNRLPAAARGGPAAGPSRA